MNKVSTDVKHGELKIAPAKSDCKAQIHVNMKMYEYITKSEDGKFIKGEIWKCLDCGAAIMDLFVIPVERSIAQAIVTIDDMFRKEVQDDPSYS